MQLPVRFVIEGDAQVLKEEFLPELREDQAIRRSDRFIILLDRRLDVRPYAKHLFGIVNVILLVHDVEGKMIQAGMGHTLPFVPDSDAEYQRCGFKAAVKRVFQKYADG